MSFIHPFCHPRTRLDRLYLDAGALCISRPSEAAHIGDDRLADVEGAKAAGMQAWLWKEEVKTFDELVRLIL